VLELLSGEGVIKKGERSPGSVGITRRSEGRGSREGCFVINEEGLTRLS